MLVSHFHFHLPVFLKNSPPVPLRRPRSPGRIIAIRKQCDAGFSGMAERQMKMMNIWRKMRKR
jgi:hypothetical protein